MHSKLLWTISIFSFISIIFLTSTQIAKIQSIHPLSNKTNKNNNTNNITAIEERGAIFDRIGNVLALPSSHWTVGFRYVDLKTPETTIDALGSVFSMDDELVDKVIKNPNRFVNIKKYIDVQAYLELKTLQSKGLLKGVQISKFEWRIYPSKNSLSSLIGFFGETGVGLEGIEKTYDYLLDANGNGIGHSIYLTIDLILQNRIEEIVRATMKKSKAESIQVLLMDAKTGALLAYISEPSFDLNRYYEYAPEQLVNRPIRQSFEPGSVFKLFSIATLLDSNSIYPHSMFDASGPYTNSYYGFTIQDIWYPGTISTSEVIKHSSNVGVSRAVETIKKDEFYNYLTQFGFGSKTHIPLPGESGGLLLPPQKWSARSKQTIALGQEIATTSMQLITAATAFTNNGILLTPQIIDKIVNRNQEIVHFLEPIEKRKVISAKTASLILGMMNQATNPGGTAHRIALKGINISAKTGTAQIFDTDLQQYSDNRFIASTLGIVPTQDPQIIIYAAIFSPTAGEIYGGRTAAPMIREMLTFILPYLAITSDNKNSDNTDLVSKAQ